jgi:RNA recognition motif-containing protein
LKKLAFRALQTGLEQKLVTPKDAVAHWRAKGDLAHSEVMRRATDMNLVVPPVDEKNVKLSIPSVFVDRAVSDGQKAIDAPSKGFGFVEFTHHTHALAALRQLNNNPAYSAEYAAGGKKAAEMQKRGKKAKKMKSDGKEGAEFLGEDGKVYLPRLIVEFAVENKVKARQQAEKVAQKEANKIKQKIEKREKGSKEKSKNQKGRGALQREKKRARKAEEANKAKNETSQEVEKVEEVPEEKPTKKQKNVEAA